MLSLPAELTHAQATACLAQLHAALEQQGQGLVEVDAAALTRFDSSALAVLLDFHRSCVKAGRTLVVNGLPPRLHDLAVLYGIEGLLSRA